MVFDKKQWQRNYMKDRKAGEQTLKQRLQGEIDRLKYDNDRLHEEIGELTTDNERLREELTGNHQSPAVDNGNYAVTVTTRPESDKKLCPECLNCKKHKITMCSGREIFNECPQYWP